MNQCPHCGAYLICELGLGGIVWKHPSPFTGCAPTQERYLHETREWADAIGPLFFGEHYKPWNDETPK